MRRRRSDHDGDISRSVDLGDDLGPADIGVGYVTMVVELVPRGWVRVEVAANAIQLVAAPSIAELPAWFRVGAIDRTLRVEAAQRAYQYRLVPRGPRLTRLLT